MFTVEIDGELGDHYEPVSAESKEYWLELGYTGVCRINGELVGMTPLLYTVGIVVGLDESGYKHRFCYEHAFDALAALTAWIEEGGEAPKGYIKRKPGRH